MTEAQKLQENLGATKTVKLKYPVVWRRAKT